MFKIHSIFFLFLSFPVLSQPFKYSIYEKKWAIKHPFAAMKVKKIYTVIQTNKDLKQPDLFNSGGKADAYRHVFFMAAFSQKINVKKLRALGEAHEKANHHQFLKGSKEDAELPDSLGTVMDLFNNELGFKLGKLNKKMSLAELNTLVLGEIQRGQALIMKRSSDGTYLDCNGFKLDLNLYSGKWYVPKCLVRSDYRYE